MAKKSKKSKKNNRSRNIRTHIFMPEEIEELKKFRDNQGDFRLRIRFIAILMVASSGISAAADAVGKSIRTIENWYKVYLEKGASALNSFQYKPKECYLTDDQAEELKDRVKKTNPSDTKVICRHIEKNFGVSYSRSAVEKLLKKKGLKRLRPKTMPGNPPSEEEQKEWVEEYRELREKVAEPGSDEVLLFCDGVHFVHQNVPGYCWGDPSDPPVYKTNSGRQRLNCLGGYNPVTGRFIHETGESSCDADKFITFLAKLLMIYPKKIIKIILDNAPYFHAKKVQDYIKDNPRIELCFLPPYAPNLNLIERLWRFVKGKLVVNTYYKKYKTFRCHAFRLLNNISNYKEELKSLMVENFQIIPTLKQ
jgi:transposase